VSSKTETPSHQLTKPVSAYVGLLLAAVEDTREPGASIVARIARLPIATFGQLLTARHRYDELANQGDVVIDALVGMLRHTLGRDEGELDLEYDASSWAAADDFASETRADAEVTSITGESPNGGDPFPSAVDETGGEADEEPAPAPSPLRQVEEFEPPAELKQQAGGLLSHNELPLPDFDHMTAPQLRGRLRRLDRVSLVQLLNYERAHANRLPIVVMLENRISKVVENGDESGSPQPAAPETPKASRSEGFAAKPAPPQNPPSHGDPTNPAQPR
jgi:hypothetical protein